jgi:hypothetical protein
MARALCKAKGGIRFRIELVGILTCDDGWAELSGVLTLFGGAGDDI